MKIIRWAFSALLMAYGSMGFCQTNTFTKFAPATGVLKGSSATYVTSAAVAADIKGLWTGTCDATTFLRGDGACAAAGGGTVSSVGLTAPSWLTVSGSPVTGSGTLAVTATGGLTANQFLATPNSSAGAVSMRSIVGNDLPQINLASTANGGISNILLGTNGGTSNGFFSVTGPSTSLRTFTFPNASATVLTSNSAVTVAQGGTGLGTLTSHGILLGEGTSNVAAVAAMAADTLLQGQGATSDPAAVAVNNCGSSTQALSYSTSTHAFGCQTISVGGTGTVTSVSAGTGISASPNPIISTGTLSVNQSFSPTWTGAHSFSAASSVPLTVNNNGSTNTMVVAGVTGRSGIIEFTGNGNSAGSTSMSVGQDATGVNSILGRDNAALTIGTNGSINITDSASGNISIAAPASGTALTVQGANGNTLIITAQSTSGSAFGEVIQAGTTSADYALNITSQNSATQFLKVFGDGGSVFGSPTGADKGLGTVNMTGCFVNGSPCLTGSTSATRFAAGVLTVTGSGSCLAQNTSNISTCTSSGTGLAHVTFSSTFSSATCVASSVDSSPVLVATNPGTSVTSTADFDLRNGSTSALANGSLSITCIGN